MDKLITEMAKKIYNCLVTAYGRAQYAVEYDLKNAFSDVFELVETRMSEIESRIAKIEAGNDDQTEDEDADRDSIG